MIDPDCTFLTRGGHLVTSLSLVSRNSRLLLPYKDWAGPAQTEWTGEAGAGSEPWTQEPARSGD